MTKVIICQNEECMHNSGHSCGCEEIDLSTTSKGGNNVSCDRFMFGHNKQDGDAYG